MMTTITKYIVDDRHTKQVYEWIHTKLKILWNGIIIDKQWDGYQTSNGTQDWTMIVLVQTKRLVKDKQVGLVELCYSIIWNH